MDIRNLQVFLSDSPCFNNFGVSLLYNKNTRSLFMMEEDRSITLIVQATSILNLNTPYHATKMQQEGVYEDFVSYMDSKLEYDKEQRYLEEQRQLAFESREDQEQTYEEWLATQPVLIPDDEPQPSEKLLEFKNKYIV